jgi:hypothetical protein
MVDWSLVFWNCLMRKCCPRNVFVDNVLDILEGAESDARTWMSSVVRRN